MYKVLPPWKLIIACYWQENSGSSVVKPDQAMEVVSRYHMSEQQVKDKKTYEAKERQAALKKNREMKMAEVKVQ